MKDRKISEANFCDTGYSYTLSLIAGKYKPIVLYCLMEYEPVRFNEMRRYVGSAADKTLSQTLKELERDGLIHREMYPEIPPKVEYTLTEIQHDSALVKAVMALRKVCLHEEREILFLRFHLKQRGVVIPEMIVGALPQVRIRLRDDFNSLRADRV